jgi:hypothetical protein
VEEDLPASRTAERLRQATFAFVVLGVLVRIARYSMNYPLWWDEAFVAVNFIRRDYFDLLRPLDYGQVCPILFLWAELTFIKLLGFSEWSLRLFPLACAVLSVPLFRHVAGRFLQGVPLVLAVAIFAVSYHPVRHAADVKPYASDLLAALGLLALAGEWLRSRDRAGWMWGLAVIAPVAISLSHPANFVAGGIIVAFAPVVVRARRPLVMTAYMTFTVATLGTFLLLYAFFTHAQSAATLAAMQTQWAAAFPPLNDPAKLARWLVAAHTGSMFAYPCGGENGASSATLVLFAAGAVVLWRRRERVSLLVCVAPFGMALAAAAMKRYPYGGGVTDGSPARVLQYAAPSICLLAGLGLATLMEFVRDPRVRLGVLRAGLLSFVVIGLEPLAAESFHPYRTVHAQKARQFARRFWPEVGRQAETVCLRWDQGLCEWNSTNLNVAVYLCNQMIYSPKRHDGIKPAAHEISENRPLRCIVALADPADSRVRHWLDAMKEDYRLRLWRTFNVNMAEPKSKRRTEQYTVYEFVPKAAPMANISEIFNLTGGVNE